MSRLTDQAYLRVKQYRDAGNLNARVALHRRYSTNPYGWMRWVFDRLRLPAQCHILEVGCGPGTLWAENLDRLPNAWDVTLSDYTPGMVEQARQSLAPVERPFRFLVLDAQQVPFPGESFDAVIANHMLYHLPDREKGLSEVHRVLRPGGRLYASTVGQRHLRELSELVYRFEPDDLRALGIWRLAAGDGLDRQPFELENGAEELARWFSHVDLHRYEDALAVTEADPLVDYVLSTAAWADASSDKVARFTEHVEAEIRAHGAIHITKDSGMFEAVKGDAAPAGVKPNALTRVKGVVNPKGLVESGYDRIASAYREWAAGIRNEERRRYTDLLLNTLPEGARVLELGCAGGLPTTRELAERFAVTGVDISTRHIEEARRNVPGATFIRADMTSLDFPPESIDAVLAFYSIIHVPREEHPQLLANVAAWLRPGGLFVASMGARSEPGDVEQDWLGAPMYWSHFDADTNCRLVEQAGLEIVSAQEHTADEDGVPVTFLWVVARKSVEGRTSHAG